MSIRQLIVYDTARQIASPSLGRVALVAYLIARVNHEEKHIARMYCLMGHGFGTSSVSTTDRHQRYAVLFRDQHGVLPMETSFQGSSCTLVPESRDSPQCRWLTATRRFSSLSYERRVIIRLTTRFWKEARVASSHASTAPMLAAGDGSDVSF